VIVELGEMTMEIAGSVSKSWLAAELGIAFDRDYYFDVERRHAIDVRCNEHVAQTLGDLPVFYTESNLGRSRWYAPDQVIVGGIQPNMIVGMLLGADFIPTDSADADISPGVLSGRDLAALPAPEDLQDHALVRQWIAEVQVLWESADGARVPVPPFFWDRSGRAAIHGAVTSGLKFLGDDFFVQLLSDPPSSQHLVDWLTDVSITLVSLFSDVGRMPVSSIHVGECAACMLDAASFRRFVVPCTSRLGERFGTVRFHSCGCSDHLLEACREITGLTELDVGGETSVARVRDVFGAEFPLGIAPLVEHMRADSSEAILRWYERVRDDNNGGCLTIGFHLESDYRVENLRALVAAARRDQD
jgi:hypothetical protein